MPKDKDLKRLVRRRMDKTGESYTTARSHLLKQPPPALPEEYEKLAGMSDDAVRKASGLDWPAWTRLLDRADAASMSHRDIATWVGEHSDASGWWAQMITVAYERFRGLRDYGQRRGGGYDVNKSKTIPVPLGDLYRAFDDVGLRERWLPGVDLTIRTATANKSMRIRMADDSPLDVYFSAKGDHKSVVNLQHRQLPDRAAADETRTFWTERLATLAELLVPR